MTNASVRISKTSISLEKIVRHSRIVMLVDRLEKVDQERCFTFTRFGLDENNVAFSIVDSFAKFMQ